MSFIVAGFVCLYVTELHDEKRSMLSHCSGSLNSVKGRRLCAVVTVGVAASLTLVSDATDSHSEAFSTNINRVFHFVTS